MDERKWLAERFEEQRPRLRAVAYRMLGSLSDADANAARTGDPPARDFARRTTTPSKLLPLRLGSAIWRQAKRTPHCPDTPRLEGKIAMVTVPTQGRSRDQPQGGKTRSRRRHRRAYSVHRERRMREHCSGDGHDAASSARSFGSRLRRVRGEAPLGAARRTLVNILVANAGIWPQACATSKQGHELAFATNILGHHVLVTRMLGLGVLHEARVVILTGDMYILVSDCTSDFTYEERGGGALAHSRSKLGNLWFAAELQRRYPKLEVCSVHSGVIDSGLGGKSTGLAPS
jgi:NAD(P)-dependent dehydrogenase (short-subunit alcohol dehydrogenase family)